MARIHKAELSPSKLEVASLVLKSQPWFGAANAAHAAPLTKVGDYRFDDPRGAVGIETLLVRSGDGPVMQIPLTYRDAPLDGADDHLVTTMDHSVLGKRWCYDAVGDPVALAAFATAIFAGGTQAEIYYDVDGVREYREPSAIVVGSGSDGAFAQDPATLTPTSIRTEGTATVVSAGALRLVVPRVVGSAGADVHALGELAAGDGAAPSVLSGTFGSETATLALAVLVG